MIFKIYGFIWVDVFVIKFLSVKEFFLMINRFFSVFFELEKK